ncbi:hypothetical protein GQ55_6G274500 [Panicum hallii var. hallii]|uniref:Uncharacterized protein n=1 Tax=Panicum hallii var. hallii TaxID=1504633 RepID=A0A2T7DAA0_9POAL|nr:hypothetical protein GQ55_6G274500 [Panicum hallii var. hallii]
MGSTTDDSSSALSPAARQRKPAGAGAAPVISCDGVTFTVTEGNEVAEVARGGAARVLHSESFLDAGTGTRRHFVDVQGEAEAMLFLVSVREDQRRIVAIRRVS